MTFLYLLLGAGRAARVAKFRNSGRYRIALSRASTRSCHSWRSVFKAAFVIFSVPWQEAEFSLRCAVRSSGNMMGVDSGDSDWWSVSISRM